MQPMPAPNPSATGQGRAAKMASLIDDGRLDVFADAFYTNAARGGGVVKVVPEGLAFEAITRDCLLPADTDPASGAEAKRWCILFEDIAQCDAATAIVLFLDHEYGDMVMQAIAGPSCDYDVARHVIARAIEAKPLSKETVRVRPVMPRRVAANDNKPRYPGIVSSAELVKDFVPPDYHIDGIAQRGFLYSVTAASGTGKTAILLRLAAMTALGLPLGDREITQGRVLYFAGENPDDVTMRWIASAHAMAFDAETIDVHFIRGVFSIPALIGRVKDDVAALGGVGMIVVDTSAAYFQGEDENANVALGRHARELRELTTVQGSPCVMVACHPTKNAGQDNLHPRGGGAFIAEVDGNLVD